MKMKAIIVDDEIKLRELLSIKLKRHCPELDVVRICANAEEAFKSVVLDKPDLVFLDINMPGESGFDFLERFETAPFEVIFVTGHNDYILQALQVSAVDYILKPIVTERLSEAVDRAAKRIANKQENTFDLLKHNIQNIGDQVSKIGIPESNGYTFLPISDILHCEGWQKYTKIHHKKGDLILSSYNIGVFKSMLEDYQFYLVHRSHLINLEAVVRFDNSGVVILNDGSEVPVSRRKRDAFLQAMRGR